MWSEIGQNNYPLHIKQRTVKCIDVWETEQDVRWQLLSPPDWVSLIVSQFVSDLCVALFLVSVTTINYQPRWLHKPAVIQSITESRECFMLQTLIIFTICFVSQSTFIFGNLEPELEPSNIASIYEYYVYETLVHVHYQISMFFRCNNFSSPSQFLIAVSACPECAAPRARLRSQSERQ